MMVARSPPARVAGIRWRDGIQMNGTDLTHTEMLAPSDDASGDSDLGTFITARRELATSIHRGEYAPNQRLVESELTVSLGVSRGTLRSVFIALEQENYISLERNRGARVRQFSPTEAIEILQTRAILESAATGLAAERITAEELDMLDMVMSRMVEAVATGDRDEYSASKKQLHAQVIAASRQPTLIKAISSVPYPLVMSQYSDSSIQHPRPGSLHEHRAIVAALRIKNRVAAEAAMRHHILSARHSLTLNKDVFDKGEGR
jgi:DNA-binding GntR family transcriptional regulator